MKTIVGLVSVVGFGAFFEVRVGFDGIAGLARFDSGRLSSERSANP